MTKPETAPPIEPILALLRGELSPTKRWAYRLILVLTGVVVAALVTLWVTEPDPLPTRLHVAFGAMTCIGLGWIVTLTWILARRNCPTAWDRLATAWMATVACSVSLVVSLAIALVRNETLAAVAVGVTGLVLLGVALRFLGKAYSLRSQLRAKLKELQRTARSTIAPLLALAAMAGVASVANASEPLQREPISLRSRTGIEIPAESGRLTVPVNRLRPPGPTLEIAFLRVPGATGKTAPPTFILAGGPGESGINTVRGMFTDGGQRIREVIAGDIIGIDQRGVGQARPNLSVSDRYEFPVSEPGDPAVYSRRISEVCRAVANRLRADGVDLSAFNTNENADDLAALRHALGYEQVNLWGTSYGSHLALTLLRRHGQHIDRVLITSPEGPDHTFKRPAHAQKCLERLAARDAELLPLMDRVLKKLEQAPIRATVRHPISQKELTVGVSGFDVRLWTWAALSRIETTQQIAAAYRAMDQGDWTTPAVWLVRYRETAGVGSAMKHAMDAASGCSEACHALITKDNAGCLLGEVINFPNVAEAWGVPALAAEFRSPVRSHRPVLILCGNLDARTPLENARELLTDLPQGRLVIFEGGGHGFRPSSQALALVGSFFRGDDLPVEQRIGIE